MQRMVMRYAAIPLLLSACATVPEYRTGPDYSAGPIAGYAQGLAAAGGAPCFYPGNTSFMGPPYPGSYGSSYNCATPLSFYARGAYAPYYSVPAPVPTPVYTHVRRPHTPGTGHGPGKHKSSGHHGKRK